VAVASEKNGSRLKEYEDELTRLEDLPAFLGGLALDIGAATCANSSKLSFRKCPSSCAALPDEDADDESNSSQRTGIEIILAALGVPFSVPSLKCCWC
jgi:hypothetical protein